MKKVTFNQDLCIRIRPAKIDEVDILYQLICELAAYEGKE